jgi:hypothetical protein
MSGIVDFFNALRVVVQPVVLATILFGLWVGLRRGGFDDRRRVAAWLAIGVPLVVWYLVVLQLAQAGAFEARPDRPPPATPFAILVPLVIGLVVLLRSQRMAAVLDAVPPSWLIGVQVYRVFGGVFLLIWAQGGLPGAFALPAGAGDMLTGLLAAAVAFRLRAPGGRAAAVAWNLLGIADLVVAVGTGFLTSPGRFQMLALEQPNLLTTAYPLVMVPTFAVPLSLILHGLSLRQLRRMARREDDGRGGRLGAFGRLGAAG